MENGFPSTTRRSFLKLVGGVGAAATATGTLAACSTAASPGQSPST